MALQCTRTGPTVSRTLSFLDLVFRQELDDSHLLGPALKNIERRVERRRYHRFLVEVERVFLLRR